MLYNENIIYNNSNFTYTGTLVINVPGISSPIILNDITIIFNPVNDYSNNTTIGIVSYNVNPSGVIVFEATSTQAQAISQSEVITLNTVSGEVSVQSI